MVGATENSAGWRAGVRPGDIIVSANKKLTPNMPALQKAAAENKKQLLLQILRDAGALYILII